MFMKLHFKLWMNVVYDFAKYFYIQLTNFKQYNHLNPQFCLTVLVTSELKFPSIWNFLSIASFIQKYSFKFYSIAFIFTAGLLNWLSTNKKAQLLKAGKLKNSSEKLLGVQGIILLTQTLLPVLETVCCKNTNNFVPSYLEIMVTRQVQFCCIFAVTKDKFDYF